jgi:ABC-type transport system substrate-binding protein
MHPKKPIPFFLMLLILCVAVWGGIDAPAYSGETTRSPPAEPSGQGVQEQTPPVSGHVLRFGVHVSAMGRMDPHFAAGSQDRALADMVFNGLLRYAPGNAPRIEPDLAERMPEFKMRGGRQIWTVHLRRGVMFHDGPGAQAYEMTAEDVEGQSGPGTTGGGTHA